MRYWCISTSVENWEVCRKNCVWGMDARYYVTLEKYLKPGDKAVVYTHGGKFVAVVEFVNLHYYSKNYIGWRKGKSDFLFPYRVPFKIIHESTDAPQISFSTEEVADKALWDKPNLIDDIVFIADKGRT